MKGIVLDASMVASIFTRKDINEKILYFLASNSKILYSHKFLNVEVANALRFFYQTDYQIIRAMDLVDSLFIKKLKFDKSFLDQAILISLDTQDTVYDSSYHALALYYDYEFVTLDKKYYEKAKHLGNIRLFE